MEKNIEMPTAKQEKIEDESLPILEELEELLTVAKDSECFKSKENRELALVLLGEIVIRDMKRTGEAFEKTEEKDDHREIVEAIKEVKENLETVEETQDRFPKVQQKLSKILKFVQKRLGIKETEEKE